MGPYADGMESATVPIRSVSCPYQVGIRPYRICMGTYADGMGSVTVRIRFVSGRYRVGIGPYRVRIRPFNFFLKNLPPTRTPIGLTVGRALRRV